MNCPNCQISNLDDDSIFCSNCGIDIRTFSKAQQLNATKSDIVIQNESHGLVLNNETIELYQRLTAEVADLQEIPQKLQTAKTQYTFMDSALARNVNLLNQIEIDLQKEQRDVEKLKTTSVTSIVARIKGDKEKRLKKEEAEYLAVINKKEALNTQITNQKIEINHLSKYISELEGALKRLDEKKATLLKIIHKATMGVPDPVEDKIEMEMETLVHQYTPMEQRLNQAQMILKYLEQAYSSLSAAMNELNSAYGYADWDTFFGGGMMVDSMKHSKMSNARDLVASARRSLDMARNIDPTMSGVNAYIEEISFFWDGFMDNIFSDLSARNKIKNSMESVHQALYQLNNNVNKIRFDVNNYQNELSNLNNKMSDVRTRLLAERKRMIEDAIKRQQ